MRQNFDQLVIEFILLGYMGHYDNDSFQITLSEISNNPTQRHEISKLVSSFSGSYLIAPKTLEDVTDIIIKVY